MTYLSVVIPVFNEQSLIKELVKQVTNNVQLITNDYEIILVDDGSEDKTWGLIQDEAKREDRVKGIKFSKNFGQHYAITAGLHDSNGNWVVVMDGDFQDRPEIIPELYKKALLGFDVVFVNRKNRTEKFIYKWAQKFFYWCLRKLSGVDFDSSQANFSIISRKVVEAYKKFPEKARFYGSTIKWLGFNRSFVVAEHGRRHSGKASYTLEKRIELAFDVLFSFSNRPLKIGIGIGMALSCVSVLLGTVIIFGKLSWGYTVTGWPSIMVAVFFIGGVTMIMLGTIGIYIGRIFDEVKNRPLYVIDMKLNSNLEQ